ncbi:MAG: HEAT repeat domain-containing protein [Verrucomicrobia subdivision 3 bacterium]|nr:HEAT repeat domain-containing protein [Limisphaerales bacterium]
MQWWNSQPIKSKNPQTRQEAVEKLAAQGTPHAFREIMEAAQDPEASVRLAVAKALGGCHDRNALPVLFNALRDPIDVVREAAVMSLRKIGDITTIEHVLPSLQDSHPGVRWHAVKTLERFGWQPRSDRERLLRDVAAGDYVNAAQAGLPALEFLEQSMNDTSFSNRRAVAEALGELGSDKAVGPLMAALKDAEPSVRAAAVEALGQLRDSRTIEPIKLCLKDPEALVRCAAARSLAVVGGHAAVSFLIKVIPDPHWSVRKAAVAALGHVQDSTATLSILPALKDPDHDVRETACQALGRIRDRRAIGPLVVALTDSQSSVRQAAAVALRDIDAHWEGSAEVQSAVPELNTALKDRDYWVRHAARDTLTRIENAALNAPPGFEPIDEKLNAAVDALVFALKHPERDFRQAAAEALGRLGNPQVTNLLTPSLKDKDPYVRQSVGKALQQLGSAVEAASPIERAA